MKKITTFLVVSLTTTFFQIAIGQTGSLRYGTVLGIRDTLKRYTEHHTLVFSAGESIDLFGSMEDVSMASAKSSWKAVSFSKGDEPSIWKNLKTVRYMERRSIMRRSIEDDSLPVINWKLLDKTKKIGNYVCNSAEADVRGRHYTVWYTKEIPISNGPWKLYGLPGLILEGEDKERKVIFVFESLDIPSKIAIPFNGSPKLNGDEYLSYADFQNQYKDRQTKRLLLDYVPNPRVKNKFEHKGIDLEYVLEF
jgi:GLPGLI family protein